MHIHGGPFTVAESDGYPVPPGAQLLKDTINVGPDERWDVIWEARAGQVAGPLPHQSHVTNDNSERCHAGTGATRGRAGPR